jgi:hypothetical protein
MYLRHKILELENVLGNADRASKTKSRKEKRSIMSAPTNRLKWLDSFSQSPNKKLRQAYCRTYWKTNEQAWENLNFCSKHFATFEQARLWQLKWGEMESQAKIADDEFVWKEFEEQREKELERLRDGMVRGLWIENAPDARITAAMNKLEKSQKRKRGDGQGKPSQTKRQKKAACTQTSTELPSPPPEISLSSDEAESVVSSVEVVEAEPQLQQLQQASPVSVDEDFEASDDETPFEGQEDEDNDPLSVAMLAAFAAVRGENEDEDESAGGDGDTDDDGETDTDEDEDADADDDPFSVALEEAVDLEDSW